MELNADRYRLSEAEHQALFEQVIAPQIFAAAKPAIQPIAIIFGGQPGAGKSAALSFAERELEFRGGCAKIIGDELRDFHPEFGRLMGMDDKTAAFYTDRDAGQWIEKAIGYSKHLRVNILIEGTMRDVRKVAQTMESLRETGYQIDARALAVNGLLSMQGILQRYENQKADRGIGRMTTPEAHMAAYVGMPITLEHIEQQKIADRITLYRRGAIPIYSNRLEEGVWVNEPRARDRLLAERSRPFSQEELRDYVQGYDRLSELLSRPGRNATDTELKVVQTLRAQAHALYHQVVPQPSPAADAVKINL